MSTEIQDLKTHAIGKEVTVKEMNELNKFNDNLLEHMRRMSGEVKFNNIVNLAQVNSLFIS